ncbi:MAG: sensor histidine kinase [Devosiaceae bacterium]
MTTQSNQHLHNRDDLEDESKSLDLPISTFESFVAQMRRERWMMIALMVVISVLLVSGRINLPEAVFTFTFLALTSFITSTLAARRAPLVSRRAVQKVRSRPSFEKLITAWPQPVILVDKGMVIRIINGAASDLMDIRHAGDPLSFRLRDPDIIAAVEAALSDGQTSTRTIIEKVPAERMLRLHIRPFSYSGTSDLPANMDQREGGPARYVLIVIEDDTSSYLTERMRSDFVANASHELRTPLASITGCIETLQGPAKHDPVGQKRFLAIMTKQADRMKALIDDLLSLNRIEMRANRVPQDCVDLAATVEQAMDLSRSAADEAGVEVQLEASLSPATVRGDANELRQVVVNLLQNALKYGASGHRVHISLRDALEGGVRMVELQVKDFGPGIAQEHLPRLTERFYRAHEDTSPVASGTGLGLAIVKHIIARHRGRLLVDSTLGEGASFSVRLPYMTEPSALSAQVDKNIKNQQVILSQD